MSRPDSSGAERSASRVGRPRWIAARVPRPSVGVRRELGAVVRLAAPVIAVQVGMVLMGAVDTMMLGRVSATELAGGALGNALSLAVIWSFIGVLLAIDPMAAQAFGAGDRRQISRVLCRGATMALMLGVPATLIVVQLGPILEFVSGLLPFLSQPEPVQLIAADYMRGLGPGVVAFLLFMCVRQTLQAQSVVWPAGPLPHRGTCPRAGGG